MRQHRAGAWWVWAAALVALPVACGGSATTVGEQPNPMASAGAGGDTYGHGDPSCPASYPLLGGACKLDASVTCDYGAQFQCGYRGAACINGKWQDRTPSDLCWSYGTAGAGGTGGAYGVAGAPTADAGVAGYISPPAFPTCPVNVPMNGSACSTISTANYQCIYNAGNPCNATLASCTNGIWLLGGYAIMCPATGDAGAGGAAPFETAGAAGEAR